MTIIRTRKLFMYSVLAWVAGMTLPMAARAQDLTDDAKGDRRPYYINVNTAGTEVYTLYDDLLSLAYTDRYGQSTELPLTIYNWKREPIKQYVLQKTYGLNHFNINLESAGLEEGQTYRCKLQGESGKTYQLIFKREAAPTDNLPAVNISVSPEDFKCGDPLRSTVSFYGEVTSGRAPYEVNWYVMNDTRSAFLYQPKTEKVKQSGATPAILVDQMPEYYVLLHVRDACGHEAQQMVYLTCKNKQKKVNTVMVEPLKKLPTKGTIIQ